MSLLELATHSRVSSRSPVSLRSRADITYEQKGAGSAIVREEEEEEEEAKYKAKLTLSTGFSAISTPSTTAPNIPSRCHFTNSQPTSNATFCLWMIVLVSNPVKSRKSAESRRV